MLKKNDSTPGFVVDTPSIQWLQCDWSDLPAYWRAVVGTISAQIYYILPDVYLAVVY